MRKYELHGCPRCGKQLRGVIDGCVDGHVNTQAEAVTAIDERDVMPLVEAARALDQALWDQIRGRDVYIGAFRERLVDALQPFEWPEPLEGDGG